MVASSTSAPCNLTYKERNETVGWEFLGAVYEMTSRFVSSVYGMSDKTTPEHLSRPFNRECQIAGPA